MSIITKAILLILVLFNHIGYSQEIFVPENNPLDTGTTEGTLIGSEGIAVDFDGNVYVADTQNHVIRKFSPSGQPLTVFGREAKEGNADGKPVDVRFAFPYRLATDWGGNILVVDGGIQNGVLGTGQNRIRHINVKDLTTTTIFNSSENIDGSGVYDVVREENVNLGILTNIEIGDIAVHPDSSIYMSATDLPNARTKQYLVRIRFLGSTLEKKVIATTTAPPANTSRSGARGMAIDNQGNVFIPFTIKPVFKKDPKTGAIIDGDLIDVIFRFPNGSTNGVTRHFDLDGAEVVRTMTAGHDDNLYWTGRNPAGIVQIISANKPQTFINNLQASQTSNARVRDIAVSPQGDLFAVVNREVQAGAALAFLARIEQFLSVDSPIHEKSGDIKPPQITLNPVIENEIIRKTEVLSATANDESGPVSVQFYLDDKVFGPELTSQPFEVTLDPKRVFSGGHRVYAIARDAVGNSQMSEIRLIQTRGGFSNLDGEEFINDQLIVIPSRAPFTPLRRPTGIATDENHYVYISDNNVIKKFSPFGHPTKFIFNGSEEFNNLAGMGKDNQGNILFLDHDPKDLRQGHLYSPPNLPRVHVLFPSSDKIETIGTLNHSFQINPNFILDVTSNRFISLIQQPGLCNFPPGSCAFVPVKGIDVSGAPNGDIFVSTSGQVLPTAGNDSSPYLVKLRKQAENSVLATSSIGGGGVVLDRNGTIFMPFFSNTYTSNTLTRLPGKFPNEQGEYLPAFSFGAEKTNGLGVDKDNRIYVTHPGGVTVFSEEPRIILSKRLLDLPQDVAIDPEGNVYVTSIEKRYFGNIPLTVSRVTRFGEAFTGISTSEQSLGHQVTNDLKIAAVIHTEDKGEINAQWIKGGEAVTQANDRVIWGYFYASPNDVSWGSSNNPEAFVKIWYDHTGRIDVNFFHVSVPDIEVYSEYNPESAAENSFSSLTSMDSRYVRQIYDSNSLLPVGTDETFSDGTYAGIEKSFENILCAANGLHIAGKINTLEKGEINAIWHQGGRSKTIRGDEVVWGMFTASPDDVAWGNPDNPELFVKIWFDKFGRLDVNFFHVSAPEIFVYSDYQGFSSKSLTLIENGGHDRYHRHEYQLSQNETRCE